MDPEELSSLQTPRQDHSRWSRASGSLSPTQTLPRVVRTRSQHTPGIQPPPSFLHPKTSRREPDDGSRTASKEPLIESVPNELDVLQSVKDAKRVGQRIRPSSPPRPFVLDEKGRRLRNYQLQRGGSRFFAGGRALTSRDSALPFLASLCVAVMLPVLFFVFVGSWLWNDLNGGKAAAVIVAYLCSIMLSSMLRTSFRDPGIVPRNLHIPDTEIIACHPGAAEDIGGGKAERPSARYIQFKGESVISKCCETCCTYRPPRTSHCRLCDNCVERTDHHCTFLNTCIGRRNYGSFLVFLIAAVLSSLLVLGLSIGFVATSRPAFSGWRTIGAVIVAVLTLGAGLPICGLTLYHLQLVWSGTTTIERIRPKGADGKNLYAHRTPWQNILFALCQPMTASSALRSRKWAIEQQAA